MVPHDDRGQDVVVVVVMTDHGTHYGFDVVVRNHYWPQEASVLLEQRHPSMKHHSHNNNNNNNNTIVLRQILVVEEYRIPSWESFWRLTESSYSSLFMIVRIYMLYECQTYITNTYHQNVMVCWYTCTSFCGSLSSQSYICCCMYGVQPVLRVRVIRRRPTGTSKDTALCTTTNHNKWSSYFPLPLSHTNSRTTERSTHTHLATQLPFHI